MSASSDDRAARLGYRIVIALVGCVFGLGLVLYGFGAGLSSADRRPSSSTPKTAAVQPKKSPRAWNMALGDVVVVAQDLGFSIRAAKDTAIQPSRVIARMDSQLQKLRELYRQETEKNPALMGSMILQVNVAPAGNITDVKEISSRLSDGDFKKAVIDEVSNWSFPEIISENATMTCPLLFVREGMDITTLVQWEKSMLHAVDKSTVAREANRAPANQQARATDGARSPRPSAKVSNSEASTPRAITRAGQSLYQIKYPTSLRTEPNFSSNALARFAIGTKVSVVNSRGDWLEVRATETGVSGYIRKEFVTPVELARKQ